jgi:hypothetical protein
MSAITHLFAGIAVSDLDYRSSDTHAPQHEPPPAHPPA